MNLSPLTFERQNSRRSPKSALLSSKNKPKNAPKARNILSRISETKILTEINTTTDTNRTKTLEKEIIRRYESHKTAHIKTIIDENSNFTLRKILYRLLAKR